MMKRFLFLTLLLAACMTAFPAVAADVVVVHSGETPVAWGDGLEGGLSAVLGEGYAVRGERLGVGTDVDYFDSQFELLSEKYREDAPVAVVADGSTAFAFLRKYRDELFAHAALVAVAMPTPGPDLLEHCGDCTAIAQTLDVGGTVDLIFALRPETRQVVGVMDGSRKSAVLRRELERAMQPYMERAQLIFPGNEPGDDQGLDSASVRDVAASVTGRDAVLLLGFSEDRSGSPLNEAEAVDLLARKGAAPVFVLTDGWLGGGVLGGVVAQGDAYGRAAGDVILRAASGESVREMLPQAPKGLALVDATVATALGVTHFPVSARLVNEPERPVDAGGAVPTGWAAWGAGLAVLIVLFFLIRRFYRP